MRLLPRGSYILMQSLLTMTDVDPQSQNNSLIVFLCFVSPQQQLKFILVYTMPANIIIVRMYFIESFLYAGCICFIFAR